MMYEYNLIYKVLEGKESTRCSVFVEIHELPMEMVFLSSLVSCFRSMRCSDMLLLYRKILSICLHLLWHSFNLTEENAMLILHLLKKISL